MNNDRILNLLGLCMRARMITLGVDNVLSSLSNKQQSIVFLANDAGENIKKKVKDKTITYNAILVDHLSSDQLSKAIGKENRRLILIQDKGFIKKFTEYINS